MHSVQLYKGLNLESVADDDTVFRPVKSGRVNGQNHCWTGVIFGQMIVINHSSGLPFYGPPSSTFVKWHYFGAACQKTIGQFEVSHQQLGLFKQNLAETLSSKVW